MFLAVMLLIAWASGTMTQCLWGLGKLVMGWYCLKGTIKLIKLLWRALRRASQNFKQERSEQKRQRSQLTEYSPNKADVPPKEDRKLIKNLVNFFSGPSELTNLHYPNEWLGYARIIQDKYSLIGEGGNQKSSLRFLYAINAIPRSLELIPTCLRNGVLLKCMYEFNIKNSTLDYSKKSARVTLQEVERPLATYEEAKEFYDFCVENYNR